jgi:transcriptional adapter 2-alpha
VPCFSEGKASRDHDPRTHSFQVIEQHSIPIFTEDWGADEELALLEGAESYGLGSWADIADHIGGHRTKEEVRDHYISTYVYSSHFPLPEHCSPDDKELSTRIPREEFQARKKRRIEERKEAAKNAPPSTPKQKPTASVPACHEVQGYMPGRMEFETEHFNEAEEAVQHMQFDPGDGINPRTGEMEPDMELKLTVMEVYNHRLDARVERKKIIFEHKLLEYRKNMAADKKRTKEERDLLQKAKPFARMMNREDFSTFTNDLEYELHLRQAIAQLQDWRHHQISTIDEGINYESERQSRIARNNPLGLFDKQPGGRVGKPTPVTEQAPMVSKLIESDPPAKQMNDSQVNGEAANKANGTKSDIVANGVLTPQNSNANRPPFRVQPLPNAQPLRLDKENADLHLLTQEEQDVCSQLRIMPKAYLALKELFIREALKNGGSLKKKTAREICKIDVNKGARLFDFFVYSGWIGKA